MRSRALRAAPAILAVAGSAMVGTVATVDARMTVLDDDAATIARAIAPRPDGGPGLLIDEDNLNQLPSSPSVLSRLRRVARVSGNAPTASAPSLLGLGALGMADLLRDRVRTSGAHRVFVDDLGRGFHGGEGDDLAAALAILAEEEPSYAPSGVARRVHLYASAPGPLLSAPEWAGARRAMARSGGVWLKTFDAGAEWTPAQWLAWPAEAAYQLAAGGSLRSRVHVAFAGSGRQSSAWALGRAGSACQILGNGTGGYRLGSDVDAFVAEYRRTLPTSPKLPPSGCTPVPAFTPAAALALDAARAQEATGVAIPPGGLVTPPLSAGEPAQLTLLLGTDPLGLAQALGLSSEAFWTAAQAHVQVRGPGIAIDVVVGGDGAARLEFTPTAPGPVTMRLALDQSGISRALGGEADVVEALHAAHASAELIARVVADPSGWRIDAPLVQPGGAPGSPVLEIVPPPV